jgi:hypothetical protein
VDVRAQHARTGPPDADLLWRSDRGQGADGRREQEARLRHTVRTLVAALSVAVPIAFIAYADHLRRKTGINALVAASALVALSLVIATTIRAMRR